MLCLCMALVMFAGCAKTDEVLEEPTIESTEPVEEKIEVWELNTEEAGCAMPAEITEAFIMATADEIVKFIPVAYVANRESEEGKIYRILCQTIQDMVDVVENTPTKTEVVDNFVPSPDSTPSSSVGFETVAPPTEMVMVDIAVDFDGNPSIDMVEVFDLNAEMAKTEAEMNDEAMLDMADGWIKNLEQSVSVIDENIVSLFDNAIAENDNFFEALSYLGCMKTVDGTSYAVLCRKTLSGNIPITEMAVMFISVIGETVDILNVVTM